MQRADDDAPFGVRTRTQTRCSDFGGLYPCISLYFLECMSLYFLPLLYTWTRTHYSFSLSLSLSLSLLLFLSLSLSSLSRTVPTSFLLNENLPLHAHAAAALCDLICAFKAFPPRATIYLFPHARDFVLPWYPSTLPLPVNSCPVGRLSLLITVVIGMFCTSAFDLKSRDGVTQRSGCEKSRINT